MGDQFQAGSSMSMSRPRTAHGAQAGLPLTEASLTQWLTRAAPGDRLTYHRGFLAVDAAMATSTLPLRQRAELQHVAGRAMAAAEHGLVHLMRRRRGDGDFEHLLIARPRPTGRRSPHRLALIGSRCAGGTA